MIRLALRLALAGGREAAIRLTVIASAVALGAGLLLGCLAGINATGTQNARNAWLNTEAGPPGATDPLWWLLRADTFDGRAIARVDVAATGPDSPVPPGLTRPPGPGEYHVSPALGALLRTVPAARLGDRFPGRPADTLGRAALPGPDSLIVVVGRSPEQLAEVHGARRVTAISTNSPSGCSGTDCTVRAGINANGMALVLAVVAVALIFPVLILIGTATRLSAARREQRFAALRLVGAGPGQISVIAAVESAVASAIGVAAGFGLFFLCRPLLAEVDLTGARFFADDLALGWRDVLLVAAGVPIGAAVASWISLHRVRISPLGVARRVTPEPPRAYRVIPLAAGLGELAYFVGRVPQSTNGQVLAYASGMLLVLAGLVIAGPWLTMVGARTLARRTGRPALLVAGRRLADDPKGGFRSVSGLVLALCIMSATVGVITAMVAERGLPAPSAAAGDALVAELSDAEPQGSAPALPDGTMAELQAIPGVRGVAAIRTNPLGTADPAWGDPALHGPPQPAGLASCAQLAAMPVFGTCRDGAEAASVTPDFQYFGGRGFEDWPGTWPAAAISADRLRELPVQQIVVATDGSTSAIERARTVLVSAFPGTRPFATIAEDRDRSMRELAAFQHLASMILLLSFPIAGCSLAVSVVGGLNDRKRPFSLLRLTGVPLGVLRRTVLLESAVPLLAVAAVAIGAGFLAAHLFLKAQFGHSLQPPGIGYHLTVVTGLVAALTVIASTLPLLSRITGPETARNE
ncbi:ABC transporter permease [Actinocorallia populi]|uniref:ABC transporter permease n=1 Tax=Actinocorallia populi TaxID=2079200 RepID=UPI000D088472|nr:FtsX-like permease family protein [Actinocorallia populi]